MKRPFTHKIKSIPSSSCASDKDANALLSAGTQPDSDAGSLKPTSQEVNRRARTSAAMIGLAISMGASSLLLPQKGDEAMAADPVAVEPSSTNATVAAESAAVSTFGEAETSSVAPEPSSVEREAQAVAPAPKVEPEAQAIAPAPKVEPEAQAESKNAPRVIEHKVQQGQTIWQLSKNYQVEPAAIATSNEIKSSSVLPAGEVVKIPSVNGIVHEIKPGDTVEKLSESYGVPSSQVQQSAGVVNAGTLRVGESVTIPGNVNELLKARQDAAMNRLKEQQSRLKSSLSEWKSQELNSESAGQPEVTEQAQTINPQSAEVEVADTQVPNSVVAPLPSLSVPNRVINHIPASQTQEAIETPTLPLSGVNETQSEPVPNLAINQPLAVQPLPVQTAIAAPTPIAVVEADGTPAKLYQVRPGDTLDAIARTHGISRSELIRANQLDNPNVIRVNQPLKIPQAQSVTVIPGLTPVPAQSVETKDFASESATASLSVPTLPTSVPVVPTQIRAQGEAYQPVVKPVLVASNPLPSTTLIADNDVSQSSSEQIEQEDSDYSPQIEKLRGEIVKLRQQYRAQQNGGAGNSNAPVANIAVPTAPVTVKVAPPAANPVKPSQYNAPINPEYSPNRYNEAVQAEMQRRQQQRSQAPIQIKVPAPANPRTTRRQQPVVAAAPSGADTYNPTLQTPFGQQVSPELPPLPGPNPYLPDNPQFTGYIWPSKGVLTSGYGRRWGRMHKGIDIAAPVGTPIFAAAPGVVVYARWNSGGYGNLVDIQHPDGSLTRYAHNNRLLVREGQQVDQGQQISEMGSTGHSTGPHLHFEVHSSGRGAVNPMAFLPKK